MYTSPKKRVLILSTAYLPLLGGSELAIKNITDRIAGYEFDVITTRSRPNLAPVERLGNVRVFRVGGKLELFSFLVPKAFLPLRMAWRAHKLHRKNPYVFMHAYQASQAAGAAWLLKFFYPRLPLILTIQEGKDLKRQNWVIRLFRRMLIKRADHITAISTYLKSYIQKVRPGIPVALIPNGVEQDLFSETLPPYKMPLLRKQERIPGNHRIILSISRLVEKNGVGDLIRAMEYMPDHQKVTLLLVGAGQDGMRLRELAQTIKGVNIKFTGSVDPSLLPLYMRLADVFVRPSRSEGLGNVFLEAMAARVPVVATPVGGIPDFLTDGETGLYCKPGDPQDIADKINRILGDDVLAQKLVHNGYNLVRERYQWDDIAVRMKSLYDSIV